ncbi:hypothetical protein [Flavisolibacter ginsenosidimutans]|uniref:Glycosyltransferase family 17 n=1 Tax=Flavisolibacter ginsenosidimutans TaxID=661481 RepID=A0A5B8ULL1_9BACT|nr:hypothetical protein [Flavisolibacter ginsenosidimutans]QEC57326.1 hypothetical protein FSB75_15935 [Flavisolibacter ginsenosidimutans]
MKIRLCCPFFKENLVAQIQIAEAGKWVDEIHVTECDRTFQYKSKPFCFAHANLPKVFYHKLEAESLFLKAGNLLPHIRLGRKPQWHPRLFRQTTWFNEGMQRNLSVPEFDDNDILILSDIDEIIDANKADRLIEDVKKHGVVTAKLRFSLFYLNLFSLNWGGPPDYSYRTFLIRGKTFRERWKADSDTLRKQGERNQLAKTVYCANEFAGFHHSWLGDVKVIQEKIRAYAHTEHGIYDNEAYIRECLESGKSIFSQHEVKVDTAVRLLDTVEKNREFFRPYLMS